MKVAVDCGPLTSGHAVRGVGTYVGELIKEIKRLSDKDKKLTIDTFDFSTNHQSLITNHYDIIHYPYFNLFQKTLPFRKPAKVVVTIHDLIPLIYPKHYPPGVKGRLRFYLQRYLIKNIDGIITVSETSKKDIVRFLGIPQEKIKVIYEAPKETFRKMENGRAAPKAMTAARKWKMEIKKKYNLPKNFVLYVGDVNYNKNILGLTKACKLAKVPLVVVGKQALDIEKQGLGLDALAGPKDWIRFLFNIPHPELAHYKDLLDEFGTNKKVVRTGFVPDKDLVSIYNLATIYCQPSFYEGFGLPVIEAMSCGVPVIAAETQVLVEVAENSTIFADPNNPKNIADQIIRLWQSNKLRKEFVKNGEKRVKNFSWDKSARKTIQYYKQILEK